MAEINEIPEAQEKSGRETSTEQNVAAERPVGVQPAVGSKEVNKNARMWAMFCHLAGLGWLLWWIAPLVGGVIGALIIWQIKKDAHPYIDEQGKEAFNFQTSMLIYWAVAALLCFTCIGFVLLPVVMILDIVFAIIAAVKANNGYHYRYPLTIRFIK